jgi:tetratricopeptide (TPR) repeat protein
MEGIAFLAIVIALAVYWYTSHTDRKTELAKYDAPLLNPEDRTARAKNLLRVAEGFYNDAFTKAKDSEQQLKLLARASDALTQARSLDSTLSVTLTDEKEPFDVTQDKFAGMLLFAESRLYAAQTASLNASFAKYLDDPNRPIIGGFPYMDLRAAYKNSVAAIEKAFIFDPYNIMYRRHLAQIHANNGEKLLARRSAERALTMAPDDLETLKLIETLRS